MPRKAPATATVANAIAAAIALTRRALTPTSPTVSGSSAVARIARPISVRLRKTWMPPSSATATAMVSAASLPIAIWSVSDQLS